MLKGYFFCSNQGEASKFIIELYKNGLAKLCDYESTNDGKCIVIIYK